MRALLRKKLLDPLARQLTQGVSPERLSLALALGLVLGMFPVLGATTALCAAAGVALRLNQPAIQVANYAAYPLQLALFVPLFRAGAWLFGAPPVAFTLADVRAALARDVLGTIASYAGANLRAVAVWAIAAPLVALALRLALRPLLARLRPAAAGA
jgi:uncharacterized protein (DUF2062 family)